MWKNIVERGMQQMTIWCMRIACWIPKPTNTHSEYVILIAFPLHKWLQERALMLCYTHIACLVIPIYGGVKVGRYKDSVWLTYWGVCLNSFICRMFTVGASKHRTKVLKKIKIKCISLKRGYCLWGSFMVEVCLSKARRQMYEKPLRRFFSK
jgi:hypothetical protein